LITSTRQTGILALVERLPAAFYGQRRLFWSGWRKLTMSAGFNCLAAIGSGLTGPLSNDWRNKLGAGADALDKP